MYTKNVITNKNEHVVDELKLQQELNKISKEAGVIKPKSLDLSAPVTLKNRERYIIDANANLNKVTMELYGTAELWIRCGATPLTITYPTDWYWRSGTVFMRNTTTADNSYVPTANTNACLTIRNDGVRTLVNLAYKYTV